MPKFKPYLTDDGSIGLFSGDFNDVFHSRTGALTEAYEKFVFPAQPDKILNKYNKINLLDICYGIGYNSKAFLNFIIKKHLENYQNTTNTVSIDDDNLQQKKYSKNSELNLITNSEATVINVSDSAGTMQNNSGYNNFPTISIDAIELEHDFVYLSGFIKENCYNNDLKILPIVDDLIIDKLIEQFGIDFLTEVKKMEYHKFYSRYFDKNRLKVLPKHAVGGCNYTHGCLLSALLHNIYYQNISKQLNKGVDPLMPCDYRYISKRYFKDFYSLLLDNVNIKYHIEDARRTIKNLDKQYDCIFLDAFTPAKAPALWSVEFFKELYRLISPDGILLTYSNSARIRNSMRLAGFYIGTIKDSKGYPAGTAASKSMENITCPLTDEEKAKLYTKSGIPYRDYTLSSSKEQILKDLQEQVGTSNLPTLSQYLKGVRSEI